ncbi:uncharacterized protein LOC113765746 [Coffea eugenioides]|uniref:uncharacterized protein LOC113765746 n=1 Tax=Coffea eugenioides TaxID=49369 RepID=UPI000F60DD19|nr:uncharacterized protein LOC113765746 [Coffea eugenioides]
MAVTHADLAPSPPSSDLGSKTGAFLMVMSVFFGLICFILCLLAEATRSQVIRMKPAGLCVYSGSGKLPLLCAAGAFFALAIAMVVQHTFLLIAVSKSTTLPLINWDPDSDSFKALTWQAGFFFVATWISFAVGEILLLIGLSVESGHLRNWGIPRPSCLTIGEGLFTAAGVFGLVTVFLAAGLYITALRAQKLAEDEEIVRREVLEASELYATPPRSPRRVIRAVANENTVARHDRNQQSLADYLTEFEKYSNLM